MHPIGARRLLAPARLPARTCGVLDAGAAGLRRDGALVVVLPAHAHSEWIEAEYLLDRSCPRWLPDSLALDHQTVALIDFHWLLPFPASDTACVRRHASCLACRAWCLTLALRFR